MVSASLENRCLQRRAHSEILRRIKGNANLACIHDSAVSRKVTGQVVERRGACDAARRLNAATRWLMASFFTCHVHTMVHTHGFESRMQVHPLFSLSLQHNHARPLTRGIPETPRMPNAAPHVCACGGRPPRARPCVAPPGSACSRRPCPAVRWSDRAHAAARGNPDESVAADASGASHGARRAHARERWGLLVFRAARAPEPAYARVTRVCALKAPGSTTVDDGIVIEASEVQS